MKKQIYTVTLASIALLAANNCEAGKELKKNQVPQPVLEAFAKEQPKASIKEYEEENWDGQTVYEIEYKEKGVEYEYYYSADGTLLRKSEEIKVAELPAAVVEAVKKAHPNAVIKEAERKTAPDGTFLHYEVEIKVGGKELEVEVDLDGNILKTKED